ncbi:hypothetical protein V1478_000321 [Vespula squamosa]|uniref:Uncharacterized protein n=1 Tax=Vespula squamosa TaxID=30214 RepID=A0ABD2C5A7_VESSQ
MKETVFGVVRWKREGGDGNILWQRYDGGVVKGVDRKGSIESDRVVVRGREDGKRQRTVILCEWAEGLRFYRTMLPRPPDVPIIFMGSVVPRFSWIPVPTVSHVN